MVSSWLREGDENKEEVYLRRERKLLLHFSLSIDISNPHPIKTLPYSFYTPISEKRVNKPNTHTKKKKKK